MSSQRTQNTQPLARLNSGPFDLELSINQFGRSICSFTVMFMSWITLRPPLSIDKVNYSYSLDFFEHIFATTYLHNDTEKIRITEIQTSL